MNVKRVDKRIARREYEKGNNVYLQSCRMPFDSMWQYPCLIFKQENWTFDEFVNAFEWRNCDNERGRYAHYYIEEKTEE